MCRTHCKATFFDASVTETNDDKREKEVSSREKAVTVLLYQVVEYFLG